jgi:hypothetical protein
LIGKLTRIASRRNVHVIFVQGDMEDGPAIALYESLGTKKTARHFDITVTTMPAGVQVENRDLRTCYFSADSMLNRQSSC